MKRCMSVYVRVFVCARARHPRLKILCLLDFDACVGVACCFCSVCIRKSFCLWPHVRVNLMCWSVQNGTLEIAVNKTFDNLRGSCRCISGPSFLLISSHLGILCAAVAGPQATPILLIAHNCLVDVYFLISSNITGGAANKTWMAKGESMSGKCKTRERA